MRQDGFSNGRLAPEKATVEKEYLAHLIGPANIKLFIRLVGLACSYFVSLIS